MDGLGPGRVRSVHVAETPGKKATALGATRDLLLKKALCFSPRWRQIDFMVPMSDASSKRWIPEFGLAEPPAATT